MPADFNGTWRNQLGSRLELRAAGGNISGRFESGVGDNGETLWVDVGGRFLEDVITFNAVYPNYGTVVSWVGQHTTEKGAEVIKTLWIHATNVADNQEQDWMWFTNRIGGDVFTRA